MPPIVAQSVGNNLSWREDDQRNECIPPLGSRTVEA
jgi:hypothetical protein